MADTVALPARDFAGYLSTYTHDMAFSEEDPAAILDRYHTDDIVWINDGIRFDRDKLIAHAKPVRKNAIKTEGLPRVEISEIVAAGNRIAARYTLHAATRYEREIVMDIHMFGELAPDGRLCRIDAITRDRSKK